MSGYVQYGRKPYRRKRPRKGWGTVWADHTTKEQRQAILRRDGWECRYCGDKATQVDHVLPLWRGGFSKNANLVASCAPCNRAKAAKLDCPQTRRLANQGHRFAIKALKIARVTDKWRTLIEQQGLSP